MPTFTNQASLTFRNTVTNSNVVTGNILESITLTKDAVVGSYSRGDTITYVVTAINSGAVQYSGLTLIDNLGQYTVGTDDFVPLDYIEGSLKFYLNGVLQPTPAITINDAITLTPLTIPAGATAMFIYEVEANAYAPLGVGDSIVNTVTLSGGNLPEALTASETVTPENIANLSITKALSPTTVTEDGQITYTFVVQNTGNADTVATDNVVITDLFNPVLQNIVVTYNGATITEGTGYTYENGLFATLPGVITVPAATYTRDENGTWIIDPGVAVVTVTGTM